MGIHAQSKASYNITFGIETYVPDPHCFNFTVYVSYVFLSL